MVTFFTDKKLSSYLKPKRFAYRFVEELRGSDGETVLVHADYNENNEKLGRFYEESYDSLDLECDSFRSVYPFTVTKFRDDEDPDCEDNYDVRIYFHDPALISYLSDYFGVDMPGRPHGTAFWQMDASSLWWEAERLWLTSVFQAQNPRFQLPQLKLLTCGFLQNVAIVSGVAPKAGLADFVSLAFLRALVMPHFPFLGFSKAIVGGEQAQAAAADTNMLETLFNLLFRPPSAGDSFRVSELMAIARRLGLTLKLADNAFHAPSISARTENFLQKSNQLRPTISLDTSGLMELDEQWYSPMQRQQGQLMYMDAGSPLDAYSPASLEQSPEPLMFDIDDETGSIIPSPMMDPDVLDMDRNIIPMDLDLSKSMMMPPFSLDEDLSSYFPPPMYSELPGSLPWFEQQSFLTNPLDFAVPQEAYSEPTSSHTSPAPPSPRTITLAVGRPAVSRPRKRNRENSVVKFTCERCGDHFTTVTNRNRHNTSSRCAAEAFAGLPNRRSNRYECTKCPKTYNRKDNLDKHLREKHGGPRLIRL